VSSADYNRIRREVILMAIPSQVRGSGAFSEVIVQDWRTAKLLKPSAIKPVFATVERALVIKTLGRLSPRDRQMLREAITKIVG
jgi:mRNA interferase MazF